MIMPQTSVSSLDLAPLARNAVSRGYLSSSCYLIDIEAAFELRQGGTGLATNSFSVDINGAPPVPATCSAVYSVPSSWSGGLQGQVTVTTPAPARSTGGLSPGRSQITVGFNATYAGSSTSPSSVTCT
jgi:hypothetical protein